MDTTSYLVELTNDTIREGVWVVEFRAPTAPLVALVEGLDEGDSRRDEDAVTKCGPSAKPGPRHAAVAVRWSGERTD